MFDLAPVLALVLALPFFAATVVGMNALVGQRLSERAVARIVLGALGLSLLGTAALFARSVMDGAAHRLELFTWLESGAYRIPVELYVDPLSSAVSLMITAIGALVARFSVPYMHRESGYSRYFAVLSLFIGEMLLLVLGGNLVMTFLGWEGAGLSSYLLIGFYYDRKTPPKSATYAFLTKRIGDAGFLLAIFLAFEHFGTVSYSEMFARAGSVDHRALTFIGLGLLTAAAAKSAQLPFSPWIARAMEGPTPSSALFYGSVMVSAGIFLVLRVHPLLELAPDALRAMAAMGAATALYGGLVSLVQTDVKSGLIFSTVSQLGLMFLAVGMGAQRLALLHLFAHAILRGAQFLQAPSALLNVPRAEPEPAEKPVAGEIDPAFWLLLAGLLGILALPFVTEIWDGPEATFSPGAFLSAAGAGMALFCGGHYLMRFAQRTLAAGPAHDSAEGKAWSAIVEHGPAWIAPIVVGAVGISLGLTSGGSSRSVFDLALGPLLAGNGLGRAAHPVWSFGLLLLLGGLLVAGWATALYFHRAAPERPGILPTRLRRLYMIALARFWLEPLYRKAITEPVLGLGRALDRVDASLIDRAMGRPLSPEDAPAPLAAFQEKLLAGEIDDADPFAAVRAALERNSGEHARAGLPRPPVTVASEEDFARARGIAGRALQYASTLAHLLESHLVVRAIGRGIPVTGDLLGRMLDRVESVLERPTTVGMLVVLSLFVVVRWIG